MTHKITEKQHDSLVRVSSANNDLTHYFFDLVDKHSLSDFEALSVITKMQNFILTPF